MQIDVKTYNALGILKQDDRKRLFELVQRVRDVRLGLREEKGCWGQGGGGGGMQAQSLQRAHAEQAGSAACSPCVPLPPHSCPLFFFPLHPRAHQLTRCSTPHSTHAHPPFCCRPPARRSPVVRLGMVLLRPAAQRAAMPPPAAPLSPRRPRCAVAARPRACPLPLPWAPAARSAWALRRRPGGLLLRARRQRQPPRLPAALQPWACGARAARGCAWTAMALRCAPPPSPASCPWGARSSPSPSPYPCSSSLALPSPPRPLHHRSAPLSCPAPLPP